MKIKNLGVCPNCGKPLRIGDATMTGGWFTTYCGRKNCTNPGQEYMNRVFKRKEKLWNTKGLFPGIIGLIEFALAIYGAYCLYIAIKTWMG